MTYYHRELSTELRNARNFHIQRKFIVQHPTVATCNHTGRHFKTLHDPRHIKHLLFSVHSEGTWSLQHYLLS